MLAHTPSTPHHPRTGLRRFVALAALGLLTLAGWLPVARPVPDRSAPAPALAAEQAGACDEPAPQGGGAKGEASTPVRRTAGDPMKRIEAGDAFPYSAVVRVVTTYPDRQTFVGSGALIDRYHVLTAGHCVYNARHGGWAKDQRVYAGQTGSTKPFKVAHGVNNRTFNSFIDDDKASKDGKHMPGDGDIGLITLDRALGDETGWFGFGWDDDDFFNGRSMYKAGYPAAQGYSGFDLYLSHGRVLGAHAGTGASFGYVDWDVKSMPAVGGQSGSGLYVVEEKSGQTIIYAVHDLGNSDRGYAEVITKDVFETLQGWLAEDAPDEPDDEANP
jgi:V8-like Glu-specific endopeptidase